MNKEIKRLENEMNLFNKMRKIIIVIAILFYFTVGLIIYRGNFVL